MATIEALINPDQERGEIHTTSDLANLLSDEYLSSPLTQLKPFENAWVVTDLLTSSECQSLINETEDIGYGRTHYQPRYRGNLRLILDDPNLADKLWVRIQHLLGPDFSITDPHGRVWLPFKLNERFRFAKYYPGDQFGRHADD